MLGRHRPQGDLLGVFEAPMTDLDLKAIRKVLKIIQEAKPVGGGPRYCWDPEDNEVKKLPEGLECPYCPQGLCSCPE